MTIKNKYECLLCHCSYSKESSQSVMHCQKCVEKITIIEAFSHNNYQPSQIEYFSGIALNGLLSNLDRSDLDSENIEDHLAIDAVGFAMALITRLSNLKRTEL